MISGKFGELLAAHDRIVKIIWMAMCGALVAYAAFPFFISMGLQQADQALGTLGEPTEHGSLVGLLTGVAVALVIVSLVTHRKQFSDEKLGSLLRVAPTADKLAQHIQSPADRAKHVADLETMGVDDLRVYSVVLSRQTPTIAVLAMQEAVGLLGLVVAFVGRDATLVLPFVAVALCLHLGLFPNSTKLAERIQKLSLTVPVVS